MRGKEGWAEPVWVRQRRQGCSEVGVELKEELGTALTARVVHSDLRVTNTHPSPAWGRQWHLLQSSAWRIPWAEEPGRLQPMGSLRVGHDRVTSLSLFTFMHWRRKWLPTPVFLPGESQGRGAWWAAVPGVAQSWPPQAEAPTASPAVSLDITQHHFLS